MQNRAGLVDPLDEEVQYLPEAVSDAAAAAAAAASGAPIMSYRSTLRPQLLAAADGRCLCRMSFSVIFHM